MDHERPVRIFVPALEETAARDGPLEVGKGVQDGATERLIVI